MLRPQGESVTAGLPGGAAGAASSRWGKASLAVLLLCHLLLTWHFLPLTQLAEPYVSSIDFPMHTHNAQVFRDAVRESGWWWGYDPAVCAGVFINPAQTTSRPQEILCTLLPFLSAGQAVTLFSFLGVLLMPVWVYLACRRSSCSFSACGSPTDSGACWSSAWSHSRARWRSRWSCWPVCTDSWPGRA